MLGREIRSFLQWGLAILIAMSIFAPICSADPAVEPRPSTDTDPPPTDEPEQPSPNDRVALTRTAVPAVTSLARYRRSRFRLASVPNMYGDTLPPGGQLAITKGLGIALTDLPLAGGARRIKVSENNKALPMDRLILNYNHFHNARGFFYDFLGPPIEADFNDSIDRFTIGFEKTFFNEQWSLDLRLPLVSRYSVTIPRPVPAYSIAGEEIGNLHATVKGLLYADEQLALSAGLGIDLPTGGDVSGTMGGIYTFGVSNDAVHLAPFIGFVHHPDDIWFTHGFLEVDLPLGGNRVSVDAATGKLNEQSVLNVDLAGGCWLYRNLNAPVVTGVASIVELHYTTTLNDADLVTFTPIAFDFNFSNFANQMDVVNATIGLHVELARNTTLRLGGVLPLTDGDNRFFDAEVMAQVNRYF